MNSATTSGSGYNDPDKLKAAMELAQSFKKGPVKGSSSGKRPRSCGGSDIRERNPLRVSLQEDKFSHVPRGDRQYRPCIPPSPLPPPSQRKYTNTLVSDTSQIGSGPIMGSKALEFLSRQDQNTKSEKSNTTPEPQKTAGPISGTPAIQSSNGVKKNIDMSQENNDETLWSAPSPVSTVVEQAKVPSGHKPSFLTPPATEQKLGQLLQPSMSTVSQGSQSQIGLKGVAKNNILDTFFSLIHQGLEEMPKEPFSTVAKGKSFVESDLAPQEKVKHSALESTNYDEENTCGTRNQGVAASISQQTHPGGKTNGMNQQEGQKLRPNAPEFAPERTISEIIGQDFDAATPPTVVESCLSPKAPAWAPKQQPPSQSADVVTQTGPAYGHVISVTHVHFADGFIVPGATTGQLWLQTPVAIDPGASASCAHPTASSTLRSNGYAATVTPAGPSPSQKVRTRSQKPTIGLKGSRWA